MGYNSVNDPMPLDRLRRAEVMVLGSDIPKPEKESIIYMIESAINLVDLHYLDTRAFLHFLNEVYGREKADEFWEHYFKYTSTQSDENP